MTADERAAILRILEIAEGLKRIENCSASAIEGQPCIVRQVRWSGREIARLLGEMGVTVPKLKQDA